MRKSLAERPMLGWGVAAIMMLAAAFLVYRQVTGGETRELGSMVTIRCTETGDTWQVPRGVMEKELYMRPFPINPDEGLINPKTGKRTGFPVDDWKLTVERINLDRKGLAEGGDSAFGSAEPAKKPR